MIFTKENAAAYIPLFQALADGKLQFRSEMFGCFTDITSAEFQYEPDHYRRKPDTEVLHVATWNEKESGTLCSYAIKDDSAMLKQMFGKEPNFQIHTIEHVK